MALKQFWLGSAGPYLYEESDFPYALVTEGPIQVDQITIVSPPTGPNQLAVINSGSSLPTPDATNYKTFFVLSPGLGFDDGLHICLLDSGGLYVWKEIAFV